MKSRKKLVVSLIVGGIALAALIGGTIAYFQDTEISAGNIFKAGKFNLKIDNTCHYNGKVCVLDPTGSGKYFWQGTQEECFCTWSAKDLAGELFFNLLDVKPGDNGEDTISLHIENNDAWVCAAIGNLANDDNGCEKPESDIDQTCGAGEGELLSNLFFTVWKDTDCDNIWDEEIPGTPGTPGQPAEQILVQDKPAKAGYWSIADSSIGAPLKGDTTYCLGVKWNVPLATSNIIQTDSLLGDVIFSAVQSRNMDNFKCSDLFTEVCGDGKDNDYDGEIDENCIVCGDGEIEGDESCDDGNLEDGDGCLSTCLIQPGWQCEGEPSACAPLCAPETEICDGLDNDCDGAVDEEAIDALNWHTDKDGDNYGDPDYFVTACVAGPGYVLEDTDCNDFDLEINPGADEMAGDGIDSNCDGSDNPAPSWISPTGYFDNGGETGNRWINESNAYDNNTGTRSTAYVYATPGWGPFLELNLANPVSGDKLRYWMMAVVAGHYINQMDIDVYKDGFWQDVYQGPIDSSGAWVEHSYSFGVVSKVRVRLYNSFNNGLIYSRALDELQVWGY
ncbi:MAG: hypothetical protein HY764_03550 [Candidatus Portnoybacteria bacterium]|nr:hypothetical protein [Candidatus Portnoybacteria bacterium]